MEDHDVQYPGGFVRGQGQDQPLAHHHSDSLEEEVEDG